MDWIVKGVPSTSQARAMPARLAISFPISWTVTFSQVFVRSVSRKAPSAGTDTAEMVPVMGQPANSKLSRMKNPQGRARLSPSRSQSESFMAASSVSPARGIQATVHWRSRSWIAISRLSASPLAGSV